MNTHSVPQSRLQVYMMLVALLFLIGVSVIMVTGAESVASFNIMKHPLLEVALATEVKSSEVLVPTSIPTSTKTLIPTKTTVPIQTPELMFANIGNKYSWQHKVLVYDAFAMMSADQWRYFKGNYKNHWFWQHFKNEITLQAISTIDGGTALKFDKGSTDKILKILYEVDPRELCAFVYERFSIVGFRDLTVDETEKFLTDELGSPAPLPYCEVFNPER